MKYRAMFNDVDFIKEKDLLYTLLKNRGVEDPHSLLTVNEKSVLDGMTLKNMEKGLKALRRWLTKAKRKLIKINIIVDEDADGYTSACEIANYIQDITNEESLQVEITYTRHGKKAHGINPDALNASVIDLLIVPDAGTNDVEECKKLCELNPKLDILILDHHNIEVENPYAIVINCKDGQYKNTTLSGAGVVYKFCKEYDKAYQYPYADKYLDLFALGNIGDVMDLRNEETRFLTLKGIQRFTDNNLFLKEIVEKQEYEIKGIPNIKKIGWYVAPLINAVTRVGTVEEREKVFYALLGSSDMVEYTPRKSKNNPEPKTEEITLQKFMAKECANIKARQDRIAKKGMESLESTAILNEKLMIVDATGVLEKDFTGLVANKLASRHKKPIIVLKKWKDDTYGGSGRNYSLSPIQDLNQFLQSLDVFEKVAGHDNSFGIEIKEKKLEDFMVKSCAALADVEMDDVYKVDYEIPIGRLKPHHVLQVGEWGDLWGNKLDEPLFAITDVHISMDSVKLLGEKKNLIKIEAKDLSFIKRFTNEEEYHKMILRNSRGLNKNKNKRLKFDFICKFTINEWEGNKTPQLEIVDYNVVQDSQVRF